MFKYKTYLQFIELMFDAHDIFLMLEMKVILGLKILEAVLVG